MPFSTRSVSNVDIISLAGRLDAAVAPEIRAEIQSVIDAGSGNLLLDLSGVTFVDSSGLSVLVLALKSASAKDGKAALFRVNPTVRSLLELTRLNRIFEIFDDEEAACASLSKRESEA